MAKIGTPPLTADQIAVLRRLWADGLTRILIAGEVSSVTGGVPILSSQVSKLAELHGCGPHPREHGRERVKVPKAKETKPPPPPPEAKPVDPLLATEGRYQALRSWADQHGLTMTQALQRYHRAKAEAK